jgi:hypothetical protein
MMSLYITIYHYISLYITQLLCIRDNPRITIMNILNSINICCGSITYVGKAIVNHLQIYHKWATHEKI